MIKYKIYVKQFRFKSNLLAFQRYYLQPSNQFKLKQAF